MRWPAYPPRRPTSRPTDRTNRVCFKSRARSVGERADRRRAGSSAVLHADGWEPQDHRGAPAPHEEGTRWSRCFGCCRSPSIGGHDAGLPPGQTAAEQGLSLPGRSADRRRDRCGHARRRQRLGWRQAARADRDPLASRSTGQRSPRPSGNRSRPLHWRDPGQERQGRQAPRGRDGRLGLGPARSMAADPRRPTGRRAAVV